jgi:hypothetical protein
MDRLNPRSLAASALASVLAVGCGSGASLATVGYVDGGESFSTPDGSDGTGSASGSLDVQITPGAPRICEGACLSLSATASGGTAPYLYDWSHGLAGDAGGIKVCPTATTLYTVKVTDSSGSSGEFGKPPATDTSHVTVTVTSDCSDAGLPLADAGGSADSGSALELSQPISAPWTGVTVGIRQGSTVCWVNWVTARTGTVTGTLSPPSGAVQVTYAGGDIYGTQTSTGGDFWSPTATYTSLTVPDAPPGPGIVEISGGTTQADTISFSPAVNNPLLAIVSLGTGYLPTPVTLGVNAPFTVLSFGPDSYDPTAAGTLTAVDGGVSGIEGSGVLQLEGTFAGAPP